MVVYGLRACGLAYMSQGSACSSLVSRSFPISPAINLRMRVQIRTFFLGLPILFLSSLFTASLAAQTVAEGDWPSYGRDPGGMRYSPLTQINRQNVAKLKVAWVFRTGDISDGSGGRKRSGLETTPILVDGMLYLTTGFNRVFALDPETGAQRWVYDPMIDIAGDYGDGLINRGDRAS